MVHLLAEDVGVEVRLRAKDIAQHVRHVGCLVEDGGPLVLVAHNRKDHGRRDVESQVLRLLVRVHCRQCSSSKPESTAVDAGLKLLSLHFSGGDVATNCITNTCQNFTKLRVKGSSLGKLSEEAVDIVELAHNFFKVFFALLVSLVSLV